MADAKTTQPWDVQYPAWTTFAAFAPWGDQAFAAAKPEMYKQVFGRSGLHPVVDPYRQYTAPYHPFDYLASNPMGRPGGPSAAELANMNNSLYGLTAPLNLGGAQAANAQYQQLLAGLTPGGGGGFGTAPSGPLPYNPQTASGMSYVPGQGWQNVAAGGQPQMVAVGNNVYYNGRQVTGDQYNQLLTQGPNAAGANSLYGQLTGDIFNSLGGQLPYPTMPQAPNFGSVAMPSAPSLGGASMPAAPNLGAFNLPAAPSLGQFNLPAAPSLPGFTAPNVGDLAYQTYQRFAQGQPGFQSALQSALNPNIAMPGQSIYEQVAAQRAAGGPLDQYVNTASGAVQAAADRALAKQQADLASKYAAEGSYMSGPMLTALGEQAASSNADVANVIGQMRLNAAEGESNRLYAAGTTQYTSELQRNVQQAQMQAQTAQTLAGIYGQIAAQTGDAQAQTMADTYRTQASYLSSVYGSQASALANAYGTQGQFASSIYGSQAGALASAYGTQGQLAGQVYGAQAGMHNAQLGLAGSIYGTQGSMYNAQLGALANVYGTQAGMYGDQLQAAMGQQQLATQQATQRAQDLMSGYGVNYQQAFQMAQAEQQNQQAALDALAKNRLQPGENLLAAMRPYFGLNNVTTPVGGGIGDLIGPAIQAAAYAAGSGV
jgi:hypothetical protein